MGQANAPTPVARSKDPVWGGPDVVAIILITLLAMVALIVVAMMLWAIAIRVTGFSAAGKPELELVTLTLLGQTGGMAVGFLLAWQWVARVYGAPYWPSIHWRWLRAGQVAAMLAGGVAMMIAVQILGQILPMPPDVPMDKLFTPATAWLLVVYGVGIAPFFEEFFFRGLIYPSLRATFEDGMDGLALRAWRPLVRLLAGLGAAGSLFWRWRAALLGIPLSHGADAALLAAVVALLVALALPALPLAALGAGMNAMARWRRPELLAIAITGFLFGMLHAAQLGWSWAAVLILVLVGVALTAVRAKTGSLSASWLVHCAYNGTLFAATYVTTQGFHHFPHGLH